MNKNEETTRSTDSTYPHKRKRNFQPLEEPEEQWFKKSKLKTKLKKQESSLPYEKRQSVSRKEKHSSFPKLPTLDIRPSLAQNKINLKKPSSNKSSSKPQEQGIHNSSLRSSTGFADKRNQRNQTTLLSQSSHKTRSFLTERHFHLGRNKPVFGGKGIKLMPKGKQNLIPANNRTKSLPINSVKNECLRLIAILNSLQTYTDSQKETILFQRCFVKIAEDLGEALTFFREKNSTEPKKLRELRDTGIPKQFANHRNTLKHIHLYKKWTSNHLFNTIYTDIVSKLDKLKQKLNTIQIIDKLRCKKTIKLPPKSQSEYSSQDYLVYLKAEIKELKQLLSYAKIDLTNRQVAGFLQAAIEQYPFLHPALMNCLESIYHVLGDLKKQIKLEHTQSSGKKVKKHYQSTLSHLTSLENKFDETHSESAFFTKLQQRRTTLAHGLFDKIDLYAAENVDALICELKAIQALQQEYILPLNNIIKDQKISMSVTGATLLKKKIWNTDKQASQAPIVSTKTRSKTIQKSKHIFFKSSSESKSELESKSDRLLSNSPLVSKKLNVVESTRSSESEEDKNIENKKKLELLESIYEFDKEDEHQDKEINVSKRKILDQQTNEEGEEESLAQHKKMKQPLKTVISLPPTLKKVSQSHKATSSPNAFFTSQKTESNKTLSNKQKASKIPQSKFFSMAKNQKLSELKSTSNPSVFKKEIGL